MPGDTHHASAEGLRRLTTARGSATKQRCLVDAGSRAVADSYGTSAGWGRR
jgi:hypothetical protein